MSSNEADIPSFVKKNRRIKKQLRRRVETSDEDSDNEEDTNVM